MENWLKGFGLKTKKTNKDSTKSSDIGTVSVQSLSLLDGTSSSNIASTSNANISSSSTTTVHKFVATEIDRPNRPILQSYPKTDGRNFRSQWFDQFKWLEYNPEIDACFCYVCRTFITTETKETAFVKTGYRNWKNALEKNRGFRKHEETSTHLVCLSKWEEYKVRSTINQEVSTLVNDNVLSKHRYYVRSVFEVIQFLAAHELPFRGDYVKEDHSETGLFRALFEYTLKKDQELQNCLKCIPENAKYLSPEIQNEIIEIMASCIRSEVAKDIENADVPFFCIMVDGTRDRNNAEAVSIVVRFVKNGVPTESLLDIIEAHDLTAEYLTNLILKTLNDNQVDTKKLLSQCYDGAAVMKGCRGGVQALLGEKLERAIPYVHCFNHQLHLIVTDLVKKVNSVQKYFDYCARIHKIFSTFKFKSYYGGHRTSRLLEQRWTGHLKVTEVIYNNYTTMIEALCCAMNQEFEELDGVTVVECVGLVAIMKSLSFRFLLRTLLKIFKTIEPADRILQHRDNGLATALPIMRSVYSTLQGFRSDDIYNDVLRECCDLLPDAQDASFNSADNTRGSKRKIKANVHLVDYVVTESSGIHQVECKQLYFEILDLVLQLFDTRFFDNCSLFDVIDKVFNFSFENIDELANFINIHPNIVNVIPSNEEIICVKNYFIENKIEQKDYFITLFSLKNAFKKTYNLFATAATFSCSSATCEATFSTMNRIITPYRSSMLFGRSCNLTIIPFEKQRLNKIDVDSFLKIFNSRKNRKLQLY
ncbi:hypothetical protein V9T40_003346 [Parthenolecanium corni]|uniref:TTF-type domain-containing protein n=1 Tax=Parthenolecanium corni TaxID=536013 RepID=A0AAN9YA28_9HEMI